MTDGRGRGAKNRQTKRQQKAAWNLAIAEGRMVRYRLRQECGFNFKPEATAAEADARVAELKAMGFEANVVPAELAQA